ncbi:MAG: histidinol-phosphate transaminase [Pseudomonadota bacterium]
MIEAVAHIAGMDSYALADLGPDSAVSLAQNESLAPPCPAALAAGQAALAAAALYPDPDWTDLRRAIGQAHPNLQGEVLCGAGSMELIGALVRAYAGPGDQVLGTAYGYAFLASAAQQAGAGYAAAPEARYTVSVDAILEAVTPVTRLVCVCNPGNPTGTALPNADIVRLRDALPAHVLLLVDQAYAEFDPQDHAPIMGLVARGDTVVTRTLSKAYGLAGARVGWGVFPAHVAAELRKLLNPNNISASSQAMATAAMQDQAYMRGVVAETARIRDAFSARLRAAGYDVPASAGNFVLIPFADVGAARTADTALKQAGFILRAMGGYGLSHCLRATIGAAPHMDAVATLLEELA